MQHSENDEILKQLFFDVVEKQEIRAFFQPIISLRDGGLYGYEALSRGPVNTPMNSPETLFYYAQKYEMLWELELLCRTKALMAACENGMNSRLFLNVNPNVMNDVKFKKGFTREYLKEFSIDPQNVIFEINEKAAVSNVEEFKKIVKNYKDQDYKIAIDDAGAGYSGLNMISDIHPHFLKLDMNLVRSIDQDFMKQALVKSMVEFSKLSNVHLIAEGIETRSELAKLIEVGVQYGQGFYIQRPAPALYPVSSEIKNIVHDLNKKKNHLFGDRISDIYIGNIASALLTLSPQILVSQVDAMMKSDVNIPGFCITEEGSVTGVVTRDQLYANLSSQYGFSLYYKKPVREIMSREFMSVDFETPVDLVAKTAMQRKTDQLYDFITVTKGDKYLGIVTVRDLLMRTIEIEIVNAKHLNPLTELPGNLMIEKHLEKCLKLEKTHYILYIDIDNFKSYNDVYGFEKGDMVLRTVTAILKKNVTGGQFVGHIGGDDFIAVVEEKHTEAICCGIVKQFDDSVMNYYSQEDIGKGFILSKNRHGVEESFPLMSISIAGLSNHNRGNVFELSEKASLIKKKCKQCTGSVFLLEE
jgi:EAL domain-containing protein (putative c-di-GMP-specific phosphodiesterase class I)/GGDEF domain-containing protein/CBS domain-containing protein